MKTTSLLFWMALTALLARPAHAYLDPASGSLLLQLILGGVAGLALALKLFWHRILGLFGRKKPNDEPGPS